MEEKIGVSRRCIVARGLESSIEAASLHLFLIAFFKPINYCFHHAALCSLVLMGPVKVFRWVQSTNFFGLLNSYLKGIGVSCTQPLNCSSLPTSPEIAKFYCLTSVVFFFFLLERIFLLKSYVSCAIFAFLSSFIACGVKQDEHHAW